ncbi:MAG: VirB4 family type IV secretion/conjugal transfer ATPase [Alphaproteobacteria bacterium]|nr:VirB4 family type IV secretion/conjugal transfer ATPase [Alphaproteobacteria bacterium]
MIGFLSLVIAVLGMGMLSVLFSHIQAAQKETTLKKHRSTQAGLADLLNYAAVVDDGIIVGKNGSLMASWVFKGDDNASNTDTQREQISRLINQAIAGLGNGWMVHVDAVRRPAPEYPGARYSVFPDPICAAIDEERRRLFEQLGTMYEGIFVITVTYFPPLLLERKFVELMFDDDAPTPDHKARTHNLIETFKRDCLNLETRLSPALSMQRLRGNKITNEDGSTVTHDDFLRWIQYCVTGLDHPVQLPTNPMYLDAVVGGQELWGGVVPKIGLNFIQVVAIEGFPLESTPGILSSLAELPCNYRWSSRFIFMDPHEAVRHLEKFRKKWRQKIRGFFDQVFNTNTGPIDQDALTMVADAEAAIAEVNSGLVAQGYYTSVVVLMDEDRARIEASARQVEKAISRLGFAARVETINTMDAFLGSLPGHGVENVRRPLLNTLNLADLLPTSTIWTGSPTAPCPLYPPHAPALMHCVTNGATPFRLNLHVRDLGHTFMFGPTGAGKSTHLGLLAAQLRRYAGMSIFAFDKGMSLYPLAAAIRATTGGKSGKHFTIAADDEKLAFCPLQFLSSRSDRAWAMEWIDTILALNGLKTTPAQRNEIGIAITSLYETSVAYAKEHGVEHPPIPLTDFVNHVQDEDIREALKQYTVDGMMGHLLDADQDGLDLSDFTVFEIEEIMSKGEKYALPVLLYLFRRIERCLHGQPAAIILDEAWLLLGNKTFREKIREWLKVMRKANCLVLMATQSLSDAANSGILDVIVESTATKIFLPNVFARDEDTAALYKRMGLKSRQIDILSTSTPKQHYYYVSENGCRLYDLALGPLALAFVGVSDKESIATIRNLEAKLGHKWVAAWLSSRGINLSDYVGKTWN